MVNPFSVIKELKIENEENVKDMINPISMKKESKINDADIKGNKEKKHTLNMVNPDSLAEEKKILVTRNNLFDVKEDEQKVNTINSVEKETKISNTEAKISGDTEKIVDISNSHSFLKEEKLL